MKSHEPLKKFLMKQGYTKEEADDIELEYQMILRIMNSPNDLYDIVSWLGWFNDEK